MSSVSPLTPVGYVKREKKKGKPYGNYFGYWRFENEPKVTRMNLGCREKRAAEKKLCEHISHLHAISEGLIPSDEHVAAVRRPLNEYLEAYLANLKILNRTDETIRKYRERLTRLIRDCQWDTASAISSSSFEGWRTEHADLAPKTTNHYLRDASSFCGWLVDQEVLRRNPLLKVRVSRVIQARPRRPLSLDEFQRLIAACPSKKRRMIYRLMAGTGARTNELKQLLWSDFDLNDVNPTVLFRAEVSKNRKQAIIPLPLWLALRLREFKPEDAGQHDRLFTRWIGVMCFDEDLARAGIQKLDSRGRTACLYSMRHAFNQHLQESGVPIRIAQALMRHSNIEHTANDYLDVTGLNIRGSVDSMPEMDQEPCVAGCVADADGVSLSMSSRDAQSSILSDKETSFRGVESHLLSLGAIACPQCGFECRGGESNPLKTAFTDMLGGLCVAGGTPDACCGLFDLIERWEQLSDNDRHAILSIAGLRSEEKGADRE